jgi:uncharacterized protein (TIGR03437 family)
MSYRGIAISLAVFCCCALSLNAQIPCNIGSVLPGAANTTCSVGSSFSFDFGQSFELSDLASLINGFGGIDFTYSFTVSDGTLPPGLALSSSGVLGGTFTQGGDFGFTVTLDEMLTFSLDDALPPFNESIPISFDFNVSGYSGPQLTVDPSNLVFRLTQSAAAATQSVALNNHGGQPLQVSASAVTNSGGNWLTVSPAGSVPAYSSGSWAVTADPSQLAPGTYSGSVTISAGASISKVSVLAVVTGTQPNLVLSQTGLFFDAVSGGTSSPPQTVEVLNGGSGTLNFSAAASTVSGGNWLSVAPGSGTSSASSAGSVTVSVNANGLQPGTYYGQVQFSAAGAADSPQVASVVLNVVSLADSPGGLVQPTGLIFVGSIGGANPTPQKVSITNPSPDQLSYLVTPFSNGDKPWLTATPTSGSVSATQPATVSVQPVIAGLAAGVYIGDLTVTIIPSGDSGFGNPQILHIEALLVVLPEGVSPANRAGPRPQATTCMPTQLLPVFTLLGAGFSSTVGWPTEIEVTVVDDCGNPMTSGSVTVTFSTGDPALALTSIGGGSWTGTWNATNVSPNVTLGAKAQELQPSLTGSASIGGALRSNNAIPSVSTNGVVSAANFVPNQPLAPGSFGAVFGSNLSQGLIGSTQLPLTTTLGNTTVFLAGKPLPLLFASGGQINVVVPYDVPVNSTQQLLVQTGSAISIPQPVVIAAAVPAIFTQNQIGTGPAIVEVYNSAGTQLPDNSVVTGGDTIVLFCSGLGAVNPPVSAGDPTPLSPHSTTVNDVTVTIGGVSLKPAFAGLTPTYAQLYQVNVTVPSGLPSGDTTVTLSVAEQQSAPVTIKMQ